MNDVRILDIDDLESPWDVTNHDFREMPHHPEHPKAFVLHDEMQWAGMIPDLGVNNSSVSLNSAVATSLSTEDSSVAQTYDAAKSGIIQGHTDNREEISSIQFACPFRKHNPQRYTLNSAWRSCALSSFETINRLRLHLYRHHLVYQCQKCKPLYANQEMLDKHYTSSEPCISRYENSAEGITAEQVEHLKSMRRAHRSQTEVQRWEEVYRIIFPEATVPSPFFDPLLDDNGKHGDPDQQALDNYERYYGVKLSRFFQQALPPIGHIKNQVGTQLQDIIRDCQDRISACRAKAVGSSPGPHTLPTPPTSPSVRNVQWGSQGGMIAAQGTDLLHLDSGLSNTRSIPIAPPTIHLSESFQSVQLHQQGSQPCGSSCQIYSVPSPKKLTNHEAEELNSAPIPTMASSEPRSERNERVEMLVESVLLSLGQSFINRIVDELRFGQAADEPGCSGTDSTNRGSPSSSSISQSESASTSTSTVSATTTTTTTGHKRGLGAAGDNLPGDDADDDDEDNRKRQRTRSGYPRKQRNSRAFACPFRKNDPQKYSYHDFKYKTCVTGSWPDISHLKEHIYRVHKARCSGCNTFIKDEKEHQRHIEHSISRGEECKEVEGLSEDAIESLRQLKSLVRNRQASWETLYTHFFPQASPIPDPWFESEAKGVPTDGEADLRRRVESFLPSEIAAFIETRPDVVECLTARLRERFREAQTFKDPKLLSEAAPVESVELEQGFLDDAAQPVQLYPPQSNMPTHNTSSQDNHLDFEMLNLSSMYESLSESNNRAYQNGYAAGHEEGYQQGQQDGYKAGRKAAERSQNLASNHRSYRQSVAIDSMTKSAPQPSSVLPWASTSYVDEAVNGFNLEFLSDRTEN